MRRFNLIGRSALFTPASYANLMATRQAGVLGVKNFTPHNSVKKLIGNIHDAHFPGEFSDTDVANLRTDLTRSTKNYYQLLDINPELEKRIFERELKQKYRALSLRFHPDCTAGHSAKTEIFKLIKDGYEKLNDAHLRNDVGYSSPTESDDFVSFFRNARKPDFCGTVFGTSLFSLGRDINIKQIAVSRCGQYIAAEIVNALWTERRVVILDAKNHKQLYQFWNVYGEPAFSIDAAKIAFFDYDRTLTIILLATRETITSKDAHRGGCFVWSLLSLDDCNFASAASDNTIKIWDSQSGRCIRTLNGHTRDVTALVMIRNTQYMISSSLDETIKIWDVSTGSCLQTLPGLNVSIYNIALSDDAKYLVTGSNTGIIRIWDFKRKTLLKHIRGYEWIHDEHDIHGSIRGILIFPDNRHFVTIANCPTVKIWQMESGEQVGEKILPAYPHAVSNFGENTVIGFDDGTIKEFTFSDFGYEPIHTQYMTPIPGK